MDICNYPNGTSATVSLRTVDHGDYPDSYDVVVKFDDPSLNHPAYGEWDTGESLTFSSRYGRDWDYIRQAAIKDGLEFYDWFMGIRTAYSLEETVNLWRGRYKSEHQEVLSVQRRLQDALDVIRVRDARIAELETDYVKKLESELDRHKQFISKIRGMLNKNNLSDYKG